MTDCERKMAAVDYRRNSTYKLVRYLMDKDNTLDQWICETEAEEKRDLTEEEEDAYILNTVNECIKRSIELHCSIEDAYKDIMY